MASNIALIAAGILVVFVLFSLQSLMTGSLGLILGKDKYIPSDILVTAYWVSLLLAGISIGLFFLVQRQLNLDFDVHEKAQKAIDTTKTEPLPPRPEDSNLPEQQWRIAEYERRGFKLRKTYEFHRLEDEPGPDIRPAQLYAGDESIERGNLWFRRGVLIYGDGSVVDLKIVVLFGDESWAPLSEETIAQKRRGRPVHIENAIDVPFIRDNVAQSHYAVCLGLASSEKTDPPQHNEELSAHRAVNLCRAIANLKFKAPQSVRGIALGYARTNSFDKQILTRQRAVVIAGVDVIGTLHISDLIRSSADLITLNGVKIDDYSDADSGYQIFRNIGIGKYDGSRGLELNSDHDPSFYILTEPSK